jgi:hypothetical protein
MIIWGAFFNASDQYSRLCHQEIYERLLDRWENINVQLWQITSQVR